MTGAPATRRHYLTTTIPYVNARPHLGFALELVQADVLARHGRRRGAEVRLLTGTDDNSLKNVLAADAAGVPTRELVDGNAAAFAALREPLALSFDDFIRTSGDPRHRPGVERLWRACAHDIYRRHYEGRYCVGCEQFYATAELVDGRCPEHGVEPQPVSEENWFFRLSRYADRLYELIDSGRLRIEPAARRNEVLAFIAAGLEDFSISRSAERARGWGIPVPGDPDQVIYVWWDALGNYLTALDYGRAGAGAGAGAAYRRWWRGADRRVHLLGKGVLRFHAVYWPAILLSAGEPLPTDLLVHDYLTVNGRKISKSAGGAAADADPVSLVDRYGTDAVRWWLLREVPRLGDVDFTAQRLTARANQDLANDLGNLVNRVVTLVHRFRDGTVPQGCGGQGCGGQGCGGQGCGGQGCGGQGCGGPLAGACREAPDGVAAGLDAWDVRRATAAVWRIVEEANRHVERVRPWQLARAERDGDRRAGAELDDCLAQLVTACRILAEELSPFLPGAAARIAAQCTPVAGRLPSPVPLFPRV